MLRLSLILYRFGFFLILFITPAKGNVPVDVTFLSGHSFHAEDEVQIAVAGDFTGDGHSDIVTADPAGRVNLLEGDGAGRFSEGVLVAELGSALLYAEVTDLDNDGALDLLFPLDTQIAVLLGTGTGDFHSPVFYPAGSLTLAVAVGDFNGDAILDIASVNSLSDDISVWFGDGAGGLDFQQGYSVGNVPVFVMAGDLDGDGAVDLAVANRLSDSVTILLNDGSGGFSTGGDFAVGAQPMHIAAADFNGDGNLDLATANSRSQSVSILLGRGDGGFDTAPGLPDWSPAFLATGDWNNDQIPDLASLNNENYGLRISIGTGDGTFTHLNNHTVGAGSTVQMAANDFDEDGITDLAIGTTRSVTVFFGTGDGEFQAPPLLFSGANRARRTEVVDLNGDGLNDLVTIGSAWAVGVRLGAGDGEFGPPESYTVSCAEQQPVRDGLLADINADGKTDIVAVCRTGGIWSFLGNGDGTFQEPVGSQAPQAVFRIGIGNFDGDAFPDIVSAADAATFLLRGNGNGTFQTPEVVAFRSQNLAVADFDQDGISDLAVDFPDWDGPTDLVLTLLGDGTGQFTLGGARLIGYSCAFDNRSTGDFNEDGFPDLALVRTTVDDQLFTDRAVLLNDGNGGLQPPIFLGRSQNLATPVVGDWNNDGHMDIVSHTTTVQDHSLRTILLGYGDGTFDQSSRDYLVSGTAVAAGDVNQDGLTDLVMAGPHPFWISFLINTTEVE